MVAKCWCMVAGSHCHCRSVSASVLCKAAFPLSPVFFCQQGWACPAWLQGFGPGNGKRIKKWQTHRNTKKAGTGWSGCWDGESSASWKLSQFTSTVEQRRQVICVRLNGRWRDWSHKEVGFTVQSWISRHSICWGICRLGISRGPGSYGGHFHHVLSTLVPRGRFCIPLNLRVLHMAVLWSTAHIWQDVTHLGLSLAPAGMDSWISVVFSDVSVVIIFLLEVFHLRWHCSKTFYFPPLVSPCAILTFWKTWHLRLVFFPSSPALASCVKNGAGGHPPSRRWLTAPGILCCLVDENTDTHTPLSTNTHLYLDLIPWNFQFLIWPLVFFPALLFV